MIALIASIFEFILLITREFIEARNKAALERKSYELSQAEFKQLAAKALDKMRTEAKRESEQAQDVESRMDKR